MTLPMCTDTLLCDVSTGIPCPHVPDQFRRMVYGSLHILSHPDIRVTQQLVIDRFFWPKMSSDI